MFWTDESARQLVAEHYPWFLHTYDGYPYAIQVGARPGSAESQRAHRPCQPRQHQRQPAAPPLLAARR